MFEEFKIETSKEIPRDKVIMIVQRREDETLTEWASRCALIYNIGESKDAE